ncbi:hypothetical protein HXX76_002237 [Chlamydomonas incerta]|uniref:Phosphodiesterase n=1 Tax=Chlamydomonas incerta TaxID=51695 RepID=A0A835WAP4_CHLIN|nr:hypothetical protein HXX76_002237 [Chlamydomonas incerta]|eukprot:KAG2443897.1 hypothetical protein HXX76_002237 [Chlamydomonas incerta]
MVIHRPQYPEVVNTFAGLAPALLNYSQVASGSIRALQLIPHGIISMVYPLAGNEGVLGRDLLNSSAAGRVSMLGALRDRGIGVTAPAKFIQGGFGIVVRTPIYIPRVDADDGFGIPHPWSNCGPLCDYDAANRTAAWGSAAGLIDLDVISRAPDSKLRRLAELGYSYEVEALDIPEGYAGAISMVASSDKRPVNPVEAPIRLPRATWVVRVAPANGWSRPWYAPMLAGVVVLAVLSSLLLFVALVSRRRHQLLLEAVLPKEVIRDLKMDEAASLGARIQRPDTPADLLMKMMGELLQGRTPELRDVVFIRTALLRNADVYQPLDLRGRLKEANFDSDVVQALMRQLGGGGPHGAGSDQHTGGVSDDLLTTMMDADSCARVGIQLGAGRCSVFDDDCGMRYSSGGTHSYSRGATGALANHFNRVSAAAAAAAGAAAQQEARFETLTGALELLLSPQALAPPPPPLASPPPAPAAAPFALLGTAADQQQQPAPPAVTFLGVTAAVSPTSAAVAGGPVALTLSPAAALATTGYVSGTHAQLPFEVPVVEDDGCGGGGAVSVAYGDSQHAAAGDSSWSLSSAALAAAGGAYPTLPPSVNGHAPALANSSPVGGGGGSSSMNGVAGDLVRVVERERSGGNTAAGGNATATAPGVNAAAGGAGRVAGGAMGILARVASAAMPNFSFRERDGGGGGGGGGGGSNVSRSATRGAFLEVMSTSHLRLEGPGETGGGGGTAPAGGPAGGGGGRTTSTAGASGAATQGPLHLVLPNGALPSALGSVGGVGGVGAAASGGSMGGRRMSSRVAEGHGAVARLSGLLGQVTGVHRSGSNSRLHTLAGGGAVGGSGSLSQHAFAVAASGGRSVSAAQVILTPEALLPPPPPPPVIEEVERLLAGADNWTFDAWELAAATQGHALSALAFYLMHREGLIAKFRIKPAVLARLLRALEAGYQNNPYHNATHAADVLQTLHVVLHGAGLTAHYLDRLGLLAAYFAAIVHDHNHPGLTNDFLIATNDMLAIRYNDKSPLENHHTASCFGLMALQPELDALAPLSQTEKTAFRKQVIEMVMGTDMKQHFAIMAHFNTVHRLSSYSAQQQSQQPAAAATAGGGAAGARRTAGGMVTLSGNGGGGAAAGAGGGGGGGKGASSSENSLRLSVDAGPRQPQPIDDTERMLSLQIALKVADIGHLGESLEVHKRWLGVLEEEFFLQGDRERALGLPISPLFDRAKQGVSKSQVGFYNFVALPLVHAIAGAFPGARPIKTCFERNYEHWKGVEAQQQASKNADTLVKGSGAAAPSVPPPPPPSQQQKNQQAAPAVPGSSTVAGGGTRSTAAIPPGGASKTVAMVGAGANGAASTAARVSAGGNPAVQGTPAPATATAAPVPPAAAPAAHLVPKQQSRSRLAVAATAAAAAAAAPSAAAGATAAP